MLLLEERYYLTTVRRNLMNQQGYAPYCDCNGLYRMVWDSTINQFKCCLGRCGTTQFPIGFIINYKRKWNK